MNKEAQKFICTLTMESDVKWAQLTIQEVCIDHQKVHLSIQLAAVQQELRKFCGFAPFHFINWSAFAQKFLWKKSGECEQYRRDRFN